MFKEPIEYLKHIKDECSFILSVIPAGFSNDEFLADETF
jgi:hypothetical protein